jgi:hypothetical protein
MSDQTGYDDFVDRLQIVELIQRSAMALDDRDWAKWLAVFTPGAILDFSAFGIEPCGPAALRLTLSALDGNRIGSQHLLGNPLIRAGGETGEARTEYHMWSLATAEPGYATETQVSAWYDDELRLMNSQWQIARRQATPRWRQTNSIAWTEIGRHE